MSLTPYMLQTCGSYCVHSDCAFIAFVHSLTVWLLACAYGCNPCEVTRAIHSSHLDYPYFQAIRCCSVPYLLKGIYCFDVWERFTFLCLVTTLELWNKRAVVDFIVRSEKLSHLCFQFCHSRYYANIRAQLFDICVQFTYPNTVVQHSIERFTFREN